MNPHACCEIQARAGEKPHRRASRMRRGGEIAGWIVPSAALALIPKCPVCVAAYVALATGVGISLPAAAYLRTTLIGLCVVSLGFIVFRRVRSWLSRQPRVERK